MTQARMTVRELAERLGFKAAGDVDLTIVGVSHPSEASADDLALAMDKRFLEKIADGAARAAMVAPDVDWAAFGLSAAIFAPRARFAMAGVTATFAPAQGAAAGAHALSVVAPSAKIADDASIGPFAVIGAGAEVSPGAVVLDHVTIGDGAAVGAGALIKSGARIGAGCRVGARTIIHENAVIGADGFSFVTPEPGSVESAKTTGAIADGAENRVWARIHSLAPALIGDDVEIGAGACVDRGTVAPTRIGAGTKIDNHVQIGHNVRIGENCLLCGQVGVAGSAEIGDRVVLGGKTGVADHARIGSDVVIMAFSGVSGVVKARSVVGGAPAVDRTELGRMMMAQRRLPRLVEDVAALKKRFSSEEPSG